MKLIDISSGYFFINVLRISSLTLLYIALNHLSTYAGMPILDQIPIELSSKTNKVDLSTFSQRSFFRSAIQTVALNKDGNQISTSSSPTQLIGQRPQDEEDIRKIFLRQSSVLLNAGEFELEVGVTYQSKQLSAAVYNAKFRQYQLPLSLRFGMIDGLEAFLSLPFIHSEQELSFADDKMDEEATNIGDATVGINFELSQESAKWPDVTGILNVRMPTGEDPDEEGLFTGSGHWAVSFGIQCIRTIDPIVLFWGLRYSHDFLSTHFFNDRIYDVQPGDTIGYNFGFGFSVNDRISMSSQVLGSYQWETRTDGSEVPGTYGEPVSLRAALTYRFRKKTFSEPSLTIGLNDDAADFAIAMTISHRF